MYVFDIGQIIFSSAEPETGSGGGDHHDSRTRDIHVEPIRSIRNSRQPPSTESRGVRVVAVPPAVDDARSDSSGSDGSRIESSSSEGILREKNI